MSRRSEPEKRRVEFLQGTLDVVVLQTLRSGPNHGYGIARFIQTQSEGLLQTETGSLYPALRRLEKKGWITGSWTVSDQAHRVREYRLTSAGRRQLDEERSRWQATARAMALILSSPVETQG